MGAYFILIFYEYFINKHRSKEIWGPRMKYLVGFELFIFISFLIVLFILPRLLNIPYFYFKWGIILTLFPFLVQLFKYPKTTAKFFLEAAYFFYLHFIYEVAALNLGWWSFPGKFIGWVNIFNVAFPIEEVLFWFILLALSILSYYEFFDDDEK